MRNESSHFRLGHRSDSSYRNVSDVERMLTGAGGAVLGMAGLKRGGLGGLLGAAAGAALLWRAATGHCPAYARLGASDEEHRFARQHGWDTAAVTRESIIINRPREALYRFWRDFSNLHRVMSHVERVEVIDDRRSHWVMSLPLGKQLEWNSTVTDDVQNSRIAWQSDRDADIANSGSVEFRDAPGGMGTEVIVQLAYQPPGGELGRSLAKLWPQAPGALLESDLRDLKKNLESGELSLTEYSGPGKLSSEGPSAQRH